MKRIRLKSKTIYPKNGYFCLYIIKSPTVNAPEYKHRNVFKFFIKTKQL